MKIIPVNLPRKKASVACLVDDADYAELNKRKWTLTKGYAVAHGDKRGTSVSMHAIIKGIVLPGKIIDHANGNKLDNRKSNLRFCDRRQNNWNSSVRKINRLGCKGISKEGTRYRVRVSDGKNKYSIHVGMFGTLTEAKNAYDLAARKYHGEFFHP